MILYRNELAIALKLCSEIQTFGQELARIHDVAWRLTFTALNKDISLNPVNVGPLCYSLRSSSRLIKQYR